MGEIIILDKSQADTLLSLGFKYHIRDIDRQTAYIFIQTKELMEELNSNFENGSFFVSNTVCF